MHMPSFTLTEITTRDGVVHQGLFFKPKKPGKKALLWIHGLTGKFYGNVSMMNAMGEECEKRGFGFATFNNRGHDMITGAHKRDESSSKGYSYVTIGSGVEKFEESVLDIRAGIDFLVGEGFKEVYVVGMSTGANKACYYGATQRDSYLSGVILLSPISDRLSPKSHVSWFKKMYLQLLVAMGKGEMLLVGNGYFPGTPRRFLSLITPRSAEDIFDYGDTKDTLSRFATIHTPVCIAFGENDDNADRPILEIKKIFDANTNSKKYKSFIVREATHGFDGKERVLVATIIQWVATV